MSGEHTDMDVHIGLHSLEPAITTPNRTTGGKSVYIDIHIIDENERRFL